jgi:CxxC-x17-CxxC domain-containing protein
VSFLQKFMPELETSTESQQQVRIEESHFVDESIRCIDCDEDFVWTAGEQLFYFDKGLKNPPKRCKSCKQAKNERLSAIANAQTMGVKQKVEVIVNCANCGTETTVPFYPSQGRPVFCRSCFLSMYPNLLPK